MTVVCLECAKWGDGLPGLAITGSLFAIDVAFHVLHGVVFNSMWSCGRGMDRGFSNPAGRHSQQFYMVRLPAYCQPHASLSVLSDFSLYYELSWVSENSAPSQEKTNSIPKLILLTSRSRYGLRQDLVFLFEQENRAVARFSGPLCTYFEVCNVRQMRFLFLPVPAGSILVSCVHAFWVFCTLNPCLASAYLSPVPLDCMYVTRSFPIGPFFVFKDVSDCWKTK